MSRVLFRFTGLCLTLCISFLSNPNCVNAELSFSINSMYSAQSLDFKKTTGLNDENSNLNDARLNLYADYNLSRNIWISTSLWLANDWTHENGNIMNTMTSPVEIRRAYIYHDDVFNMGFGLKFGRIDIPFGYEYESRTNNADDSKNPFITNSMLDINGVDEGISLSGDIELAYKSRPVHFEMALLNGGLVPDGTASGINSNAQSNGDLASALKVVFGPMDNLDIDMSFFGSSQVRDRDDDPLRVGGSLMMNSLTSLSNIRGLTSVDTDPDGRTFDRKMYEFGAKIKYKVANFNIYYGIAKADQSDTSGSVTKYSWNYMGIGGKLDINRNSYVALRYTILDPSTSGSVEQGKPHSWGFAAGYKITEHIRTKIEYSAFLEDGDAFGSGGSTPDQVVNNARAFSFSVSAKF